MINAIVGERCGSHCRRCRSKISSLRAWPKAGYALIDFHTRITHGDDLGGALCTMANAVGNVAPRVSKGNKSSQHVHVNSWLGLGFDQQMLVEFDVESLPPDRERFPDPCRPHNR